MTKRHHTARYYTGRFFFYGLLCLFGLVCLLPLYWMFRASFMKNTQILILDPFVFWPKKMIWGNYSEALSSMNFLLYLGNTLTIAAGNMIGTLLTSAMAAYAFSRLRWRGRNFCFALILSTMMMPGTVTLISQYLMWNGVHSINTFVPLVLPAFLGGGAFNIFLLRQFFLGIPKALDEAATVDGAGSTRIFFSIILPLSKSALIVVSLFTFLGCWNDFFGPLLYLNSHEKFTLALGLLQFRGEYTAKWNYIMAASTVVIAPCIVLFLVGQKYLIEGISLTGLKS
mgnify:CR=1 FL=1